MPTAVTGCLGQNLPYWGFGSESGVWQSVLLILFGTIGLYWLFRRNGWLSCSASDLGELGDQAGDVLGRRPLPLLAAVDGRRNRRYRSA